MDVTHQEIKIPLGYIHSLEIHIHIHRNIESKIIGDGPTVFLPDKTISCVQF